MALDSKAVFQARVEALGLGGVYNTMIGKGMSTYGEFAFAANFVPGAGDDTRFINEVVIPVLGSADDPRKTAIRRLFYESYTLMATDMQRRATMPEDDSKPKKLPAVERAARFDRLKALLPGLRFEEDLEPSHNLIDKFSSMKEIGELRHIPWNELTRRDKEVRGDRKEDCWTTDSKGYLKHGEKAVEGPADLGSDLRMKSALQRRGVAMHVADLLSFTAHEELVMWYLREYTRDPPPRFERVSINQIMTVDKEVFVRMAELTNKGLDAFGTTDNTLVLDHVLKRVMEDKRVQSLLCMMPKASGKRDNQDDDTGGGNKKFKGNKKDKGAGKVKEGGKQKGDKGAGKKSKDRSSLPKELIGMTSRIGNERVCFAFNLGGCSAGASCKKGVHKCMVPNCGSSSHGQRDCPNK